LSAGLALALLLLVVQQHHHADPLETVRCVACAVRSQAAAPPVAPVVVGASVFITQETGPADQSRPAARATPTPRAQGPPAA
jgi:hypothetical protein